MRDTRWLRLGLVSSLVLGAGMSAFVVACGDDDSTPSGNLPDSGSETSTGTSGGPTDSGNDGSSGQVPVDAGDSGPVDSGKKTPAAKLQLVNAAVDLGPNEMLGGLRICYKAGIDVAHAGFPPALPPLPNRNPKTPYPGLFIGTGGSVEGSGSSLAQAAIVPYVISGASLQARGLGSQIAPKKDLECAKILGADGSGDPSPGQDAGFAPLKENKDFWVLDPIPANSFVDGNNYLLVLTGCTADSDKGEKCGTGFTTDPAGGKGTLTIHRYQLDNKTVVAADKVGLQFINTSGTLDGLLKSFGQDVDPAVVTDPADASDAKHFGAFDDGGDAGGPVSVGQLTSLYQLSNVNLVTDSVTPNVPLLGAKPSLAIPFIKIKALTYGVFPDGGINVPSNGDYLNGKAYTVIAIGDPQEDPDASGNFNTKTYHLLMLPNEPDTKLYTGE